MDKDVKQIVEQVVTNYFPVAKDRVEDICQVITPLDTNVPNMAINYYQIAHYIVTHCNENQIDVARFVTYATKQTMCYISPYAKLNGLILQGVNVYIDGCVVADDGLVVGNHVTIGKCQYNENIDTNSIVIGKNCHIGNNVKIYPNVTIGDNVTIDDNCIIKEDLTSNVNVSIVNQLQLKHSRTTTFVSSQILMVYGIVPKFKNTFVIYGEGFYNPKVVIRLKSGKSLNYEIAYWDKNKIIIKIRDTKPIADECLVVVMSNGNKITLINNFGVIKTLKSLN